MKSMCQQVGERLEECRLPRPSCLPPDELDWMIEGLRDGRLLCVRETLEEGRLRVDVEFIHEAKHE